MTTREQLEHALAGLEAQRSLLGDAVMALWGVDEAREDDPEQAIHAALAMQTAVHTFATTHHLPLKMRIGLNTGPALLGEVGTRAEFTAMGDTVNTASRLEQAAPVGAILISHNTYYFLVRDLLATRFGIRESDPIEEIRQKFETAIAGILTDQAEMKAHFLGQWLGYDFLVANRAEGNPFYMEELVKMLIDNGVIVPEEEQWQIDLTQLDESQIPGTLTGVLQARLDRLAANEKVTLQRASVVGRVFWDTAVKQLGDDPNQVQLTPLQSRELIYKQSETAFTGTEQFLFKHDLLRDVTYQTVLKKARQLYHGQIADWLVEVAAMNGRVDEYAAVIGEHYQLAGKPDQAALWYGRAGQYAAAHYAHEETIHYLNLALEFTNPDDYAARYTLLQLRKNTYRLQGSREAQRADLDTLTSLANNLSIAEQANVALQRVNYAIMTSDYTTAIATVQAAIKLAQAAMASNLIAKGHSFWGTALFRQGKYPAAKIQYATGYRLAKDVGEQQVIATCLQGLGSVVQNQGDYMAASVYYHQALAICREIGDRYGEGVSLNRLGGVADEQEDYVKAQQYFEQALTINRESGNRMGEAMSLGNLGFGALCQGAYARACGYFEQALLISREINNRLMEGIGLINLGEVAANQGEYAKAYLYFEPALAIFRKIGVRDLEGICLNESGAVALSQANISLAETFYRQAMTIRQELNLLHYLVEDWAGLAQVRLAQGDQAAARHYREQVLNYLEENSRLNGAENPLRVFRFTWEVLVALGQPEEAAHLLALARQIMQAYLAKNSDPALQELYLSQPHHRQLWTADLAIPNGGDD
jgi:predicted ATPase